MKPGSVGWHPGGCEGCWHCPGGHVCCCTVGHGGHERFGNEGGQCSTGHVCIATVGHGAHETSGCAECLQVSIGHVTLCTVGHGCADGIRSPPPD